MIHSIRVNVFLTVLAVASHGVPAAQPCTPEWTLWGNYTQASNIASFSMLPDGNVVAASIQYAFTGPSGEDIEGLAQWDGAQWSKIGTGLEAGNPGHAVIALLRLPNGDVIIGGQFTFPNQTPESVYVSRWDGAAWSNVGEFDKPGTTYALARMPDGKIVSGGNYLVSGGGAGNAVSIFDGSGWKPLGSGVIQSSIPSATTVYSLAVLQDGSLIAGGFFDTAGGIPALNVARWNGSSWTKMGLGLGPGDREVRSLHVAADGKLYAGGSFIASGATQTFAVARWDENAWVPLGAGLTSSQPFPNGGFANAIISLNTGGLLVTGGFEFAGGLPCYPSIATWNGAAWTPYAQLPPQGSNTMYGQALLALDDGRFVVGGQNFFLPSHPLQYSSVAAFDCPSGRCYADCDGSSALTIDDFICFQTNFAIGDPAADCDASGNLSIDDFICFQTNFAIGC